MTHGCFVFNGNSYNTGTIVVINNNGIEVYATFIAYNPETKRYIIKVKESRWFLTEEQFLKKIIRITDKNDTTVRAPVIKQKKDSQIDGLFIGWIWYIFLMVISIIFNNAIGLWIFISVIFFNWRANKIKREGNYIEW